jgi:hypothetical protein
MLMYQCLPCGKPLLRAPNPDHSLKSYTPTMNGFERFLCGTVGLQAGAPGEDLEATESDQEGRDGR